MDPQLAMRLNQMLMNRGATPSNPALQPGAIGVQPPQGIGGSPFGALTPMPPVQAPPGQQAQVPPAFMQRSTPATVQSTEPNGLLDPTPVANRVATPNPPSQADEGATYPARRFGGGTPTPVPSTPSATPRAEASTPIAGPLALTPDPNVRTNADDLAQVGSNPEVASSNPLGGLLDGMDGKKAEDALGDIAKGMKPKTDNEEFPKRQSTGNPEADYIARMQMAKGLMGQLMARRQPMGLLG